MTSIDECVEVVIEALPCVARLNVKGKKSGVRPGLGWQELERLSSLRVWSAALVVPKPGKDAGPDWDDERYLSPPMFEPEMDRFGC